MLLERTRTRGPSYVSYSFELYGQPSRYPRREMILLRLAGPFSPAGLRESRNEGPAHTQENFLEIHFAYPMLRRAGMM